MHVQEFSIKKFKWFWGCGKYNKFDASVMHSRNSTPPPPTLEIEDINITKLRLEQYNMYQLHIEKKYLIQKSVKGILCQKNLWGVVKTIFLNRLSICEFRAQILRGSIGIAAGLQCKLGCTLQKP